MAVMTGWGGMGQDGMGQNGISLFTLEEQPALPASLILPAPPLASFSISNRNLKAQQVCFPSGAGILLVLSA